MRALVLNDDGIHIQMDRAEPVPLAGEVLVRVLCAGICETDLQLIRGYKGFRGVLGHEFVGIATAGRFAGERVVGEINCSCWACDTCLAGRPGHCSSRTVLGILGHDGAFADYVAVPERNLHRVPDNVETDVAVFTEPLAAAFQIPAQLRIARSDRVVVLGDGRLGNLCARVLARESDHVMVVGKHPSKLALLERVGIATRLLNASDQAEGRVDDEAQHRADIVVDCTGSASGVTTALQLVRPRGTIVLKTTIASDQTLAMAPVVVVEVTIVGSRCGPFDRALEALAAGWVEVRGLIHDRFDLTGGVAALQRAADPGVLKVLMEVGRADS
jgi:threonine dehydrogenase-like Zn-dependent dehydrogenase